MNIFPFRWQVSGCREIFSWRTDVIEADDLTEQRRKLRDIPACEYECEVLLSNEQVGAFQSLFHGAGSGQFGFPIWPDAQRLGVATTAGTTFIPVVTTNYSYSTGNYAALWSDWQQRELIGPLTGVATSGLSVASSAAPAAAYTTAAYVMPVYIGKTPDGAVRSDIKTGISKAALRFRVDDARAITASTYGTAYQGIGVLETIPTAVTPLENSISWPIEVLDNGIGAVSHEARADFAPNTRMFRWIISGRANIAAFRQWLHAVEGRYGTFYAPSFNKDIRLIGTATSGATVLTISNIKYTDYVDAGTYMRDVAFVRTDGTMLIRRITSASTSNATQETITIDSALGATYTDASFRCISFLQKHRLDTDRIEINWQKHDLIEVAAPLRVIP